MMANQPMERMSAGTAVLQYRRSGAAATAHFCRSTPARISIWVALLLGVAGANCFGYDTPIRDSLSVTNMAPLPLRLPVPATGSWLVGDCTDPHFEPRSSRPRPPFLAPVGVTNLALHKKVTSSDRLVSLWPATLAQITDGRKEPQTGDVVYLGTKKQWVQVDLEGPYRIYAVVIWHDQDSPRIFRCVVVQTADDAEFTRNVQTLFNNDYANEIGLGAGTDKLYRESFEGRLVDAKGVSARYIRCYSKGSDVDPFNAYAEIEVWGLPER
jgi:hypothetical protein